MITAFGVLEMIAGNMNEVNKPIQAMIDTLEDGEALAYLGVTDEDQEAVEHAHALLTKAMKNGFEFYEPVRPLIAALW